MRAMRSKRVASSGVFALALIVGACRGDQLSAPSRTLVGDWNLALVAGRSLPYDEGSGFIVYSGRLSLRTDGSFADSTRWRLGDRGDTVLASSGSWSQVNDTTVRLQTASGDISQLLWRGDTLAEQMPLGQFSIYRR
jgi:hypothetical protein